MLQEYELRIIKSEIFLTKINYLQVIYFELEGKKVLLEGKSFWQILLKTICLLFAAIN